jgi:hypothetical protein
LKKYKHNYKLTSKHQFDFMLLFYNLLGKLGFFGFVFVFFGGGGTGARTWGLALARQMLYHLTMPPALFVLVNF